MSVITHTFPIQLYTQTTTIQTTTSATTPAATPAKTPAKIPAATTTTLLIPPSSEDLIKQGFIFPEIPRILCEQLKQMIDKGDDFVLVDARLGSSFATGHIPGAINIPYNDPSPNFTQEWLNDQLKALPGNKMIIFYCDWSDDGDSASLAEKLIQLRSGDLNNIKVLWKSILRWEELGYPIVKWYEIRREYWPEVLGSGKLEESVNRVQVLETAEM
jgi:rhodanese-related sulfurtransferase